MHFESSRELDAFWEKLEPAWNQQPLLIKAAVQGAPFVDEPRFSVMHPAARWGGRVRTTAKLSFDVVRVIDGDALPRD